MEQDTVKVALCTVSYKGPHVHVFDTHQEFYHYLGRLQERSYWMRKTGQAPAKLPELDRINSIGTSELRLDDPVFEFAAVTHTGNSLVGQARDIVVDRALTWGADYVLFFDDDMIFPKDCFLKLWRHQLPFVGALAFTARKPIAPVLYRFKNTFDFEKRRHNVDIEVIFDYPKNQLFRVDGIGTGVVLIAADVFRKLERPWFHGGIGVGEDIHFAWKCGQAGIPIHCDTSVKTMHAPNEPEQWHDEIAYEKSAEETKAWYAQRNKLA